MRRIYKTIGTFLAAAVAATLLLPVASFAEEPAAGSLGNGADWWRFTNSETNNAVTDRRTPASSPETWERWAHTFEGGFSNAPTPPLIVNDSVYTVSGKKLYELDKETGDVKRVSGEMPGATDFALRVPLYADGRIFVAISGGIICAFECSDLSLAWMTNPSGIVAGQMISPLSYKKINGTGYLFAGTRKNLDGGELLCVTTDDQDVREFGGRKIKALKWHFHPKTEDAENLALNNCEAEGYYNTGAYVSETFLAVGSDNGTLENTTDANTAFYTLNPETGAIISSKYSVQGAVRSSAVYENGYLYFVSTKAILYKVAVDEAGNLGEMSSIDLTGQGASGSTVTPVVHGGRIYVAACGNGGKYSADGGHGIYVIQNDSTLTGQSFLYKVFTPGYPQGGLLLSTAWENEDFNKDGEADGRVYLYGTVNTPPGGIVYTYDAPGQTEAAPLTMEESKLFIPSKTEYCISPIAADQDGTLYYKNDSGTLFAVEANPAPLLELNVKNTAGKEVLPDPYFRPNRSDYLVTVASEETAVSLQLTPAEGVLVTVDGKTAGSAVTVPLEGVQTDVSIRTEKNGKSREYRLSILKASVNASLRVLASTTTNVAPNASNTRPIQPSFDPNVSDYSFDWIGAAGSGSSGMMNLYLEPENEKATVKVLPVENVNPNKLGKDGCVPSASNNPKRFPVYCADLAHDTKVTVLVTAEDGVTTKEYHITFLRRIFVNEVDLSETALTMEEGESKTVTAFFSPANATDHSLRWTSEDPSVATVDEQGTIFAKGPGITTIKATSPDGPDAACSVTVSANHKLMKKEASPATMETEGCARTCWVCEICGRFFADEEGNEELPKEDVIIPKQIDIRKASVWVPAQTYTGKALTPAPKVTYGKELLKKGTDYNVSYKNNKNAGNALLTVTGIGKYAGSKTTAFKINKAVKKTMTVKVKKKLFTVSAKKKTVLKASNVFVVKKKVGMPVFKQLTKNPKILVAKNGTVTVKKGLKKGTVFKVKVQVRDLSANYIGATGNVFVKIRAK